MIMQTIRVKAKATSSPALAQACWEPEGSILSCTIKYRAGDNQERDSKYPLRDYLDQRWPLPEVAPIIDAGSLSLDLDDRKRLVEVYIRTSPAEWVTRGIRPAMGDGGEAFFEAPFEDDGRARCQPIQAVEYDPQQGIVSLNWGAVDRWCIVAPTLALGLAPDGTLMKIQMSEFWLPAPKPRPESVWERLKRRLGAPSSSAR